MVKWSRLNTEKLEKNEKALLDSTGLTFTAGKIYISDTDYLYSLTSEHTGKPTMIILHGYCGSGVCFYSMLSPLSSNYSLVLVDLLGMGRSSRPNWSVSSLEDGENFFVSSLEKFRELNGYKDFVLVGHSFGGYIASCYALKFPQYINSLVLLSPVGVPRKPSDYQQLNSSGWKEKLYKKLISFCWRKNISPLNLVRKSGPFSKQFIKMYTQRKLLDTTQKTVRALVNYLEQIVLLPGSGEYALTHILEPGAWAKKPLCDRLHVLEVPLAFLYGDRDCMKPIGASQLAEKMKTPPHIKIVPDAGHMLYWDNPDQVASDVLEFLANHSKRGFSR